MMSAHNRRPFNRTWPLALPCTLALWSVLPLMTTAAQEYMGDAQAPLQQQPPGDEENEKVLGSQDIEVSDFMEVTLHVQDTELVKVLQMLSIQSQKNIITSPSVSATVSADLYDVSFYEALDALLHVNGYGYIEKGNFIYVYTQEEINAMEEAAREPITKSIHLNYISAADASVFVTPALSDAGSIALNGPVEAGIKVSESNTGGTDYAWSGVLVVRDYPENVAEIERLIKELDTRPSQVLVEATILQTNLSEDNAFGVDFSIIADVNFSDFINGPLSAADALRAGATSGSSGYVPPDNRGTGIGTAVGNTSGPAGMKIGVIHDDFAVFMRLLDEVTDSVILSNPKILCLNRQRARVQVGRNIGYLSTTATDTTTTQTVEFLPTGTTLQFRPFISNDGMIRMELAPRVSEGIIRDVTNASGATVTIPDEITQELTTNVLVHDGNTIVLGGLFRETTRLSRRQVPFLGDLPVLGAAFRGNEDATSRTEIIFMVRPTIVNDTVLLEQGERALDKFSVARTGARRGTLPWGRDRLTSTWNQEAMEYAKQGDFDRALWAINRSLSFQPIQPRAIEMREKLMNQRDRWQNRSILEDVIDNEYDQQLEELEQKISSAKAEQKRQFQATLAEMTRLQNEKLAAENTGNDNQKFADAGSETTTSDVETTTVRVLDTTPSRENGKWIAAHLADALGIEFGTFGKTAAADHPDSPYLFTGPIALSNFSSFDTATAELQKEGTGEDQGFTSITVKELEENKESFTTPSGYKPIVIQTTPSRESAQWIVRKLSSALGIEKTSHVSNETPGFNPSGADRFAFLHKDRTQKPDQFFLAQNSLIHTVDTESGFIHTDTASVNEESFTDPGK